MKKSPPNFLKAVLFMACLIPPGLWAGELSLYYLPQAQIEYEGTGYRQVQNGWELKVKPKSPALGLRWRWDFAPDLSLQAQYWVNKPYYEREDGNTASPALRQTGQTQLAFHNFLMDLRRPLAGKTLEAVAGVQAAHASLRRKDIVFNAVPETQEARENLTGLGVYAGFHGGRSAQFFYWDWELLLGHFFDTWNSQEIGGGSIHRGGYSYLFRIEAGCRKNSWRAGVGLTRQLVQVLVPGGKALPTGAAASLPINKFDFFYPMLALSYVY